MTQLQIRQAALAHNYNFLRELLPSKVRFIAVLKANAYGHGAVACAEQLQYLGADLLAVAYTDEGIALRNAGIRLPIMVFYPEVDQFEALVAHQLQPALYSKNSWEAFVCCLPSHTPAYPIHLKFNTGLNRIGFSFDEIAWVIQNSSHANVKVESIYSHLAATEQQRPHAYVDQQISLFNQIKKRFEQHPHKPWFHLLNTSGVFNYPEYHMDAVRCGIGLYGFANSSTWDKQLQPLGRLTTTIVQIHSIAAGEFVGYNQGWKASKKTEIATLPLGHADGIHRSFGHGKATVLIHGQQAPIVGNVCMDMLMVDISNIACKEGDEVVLFGAEQPLNLWATEAGTIPYEVLTGLGKRIHRIWR